MRAPALWCSPGKPCLSTPIRHPLPRHPPSTVVFQALRVAEAARGRGVGKQLSAFMYDFVRRTFPEVDRLRICSQSHNETSVGIHAAQVGPFGLERRPKRRRRR